MDALTTATTDSNPPRHAIESDSEEDEFNPLRHDVQQPKELEIKILGDNIDLESTLIIATADPGALWAKGAQLGEQIGAVSVNGVQIGLIFRPKWTSANVVVSEALSRLPVWAMHTYAQAIIDKLKPTSVALLDEYSVPGYISNKPVSLLDAPIRYLSNIHFDPGNLAEPFVPPNLINTTSASFLSILSLDTTRSGTLLLLPSPNMSRPAPRTIESSNFAHLAQDVTEWPTWIMMQAHRSILRAIGESESNEWEQGLVSSAQKAGAASRRSEIGEGGMYI